MTGFVGKGWFASPETPLPESGVLARTGGEKTPEQTFGDSSKITRLRQRR